MTAFFKRLSAAALCLFLAGCLAPPPEPTHHPDDILLWPKVTHETWALACSDDDTLCAAAVAIGVDDGRRPIQMFAFPVERSQTQAHAAIVIQVPTQKHNDKEIALTIDDRLGRVYRVAHCADKRCIFQLGLTKEMFQGFKRGKDVKLEIRSANPALAPLRVTVPLQGFSSAFAGAKPLPLS